MTGVARKVDSLKGEPGLTVKTDDLSKVDRIVGTIRGADAVVSAYAPPKDDTDALVGDREADRGSEESRCAAVAGGWRRWSAARWLRE